MNTFGESAPMKVLQKKFGFTSGGFYSLGYFLLGSGVLATMLSVSYN